MWCVEGTSIDGPTCPQSRVPARRVARTGSHTHRTLRNTHTLTRAHTLTPHYTVHTCTYTTHPTHGHVHTRTHTQSTSLTHTPNHLCTRTRTHIHLHGHGTRTPTPYVHVRIHTYTTSTTGDPKDPTRHRSPPYLPPYPLYM